MKIRHWILFFLLLLTSTSFQLCKTKHLTGNDFDSLSEEFVHTIRLKEGKIQRLVISDIYADRIYLVSSLEPNMHSIVLEAKRLDNNKKPNKYSFEMSIKSLKKGDYILRTSACYWIGELHLTIF